MKLASARQAASPGDRTAVLGPPGSVASTGQPSEITPPANLGNVEVSGISELLIRLIDIIGATAILIVLAPILLVIGVVIRLQSPGPAIFRQRRLGQNLTPFSVAKFRTMQAGSTTDAHRRHVQQMIAGEGSSKRPMAKIQDDDRVTRVGVFLRRTSIDEIPQIWNVLRGEMSLVGPRPPIEYEVEKYQPGAFRRFAVKPGITGLWQVRGRSLLTFEEMIALDVEYVEGRSLRLNIKILLLTLPTVIHGKGAA